MRDSRLDRWVARFLLVTVAALAALAVASTSDTPDDFIWTSTSSGSLVSR